MAHRSLLCELSAPTKRAGGARTTVLENYVDHIRQFQPESQNNTAHCFKLDGCAKCSSQLQTVLKSKNLGEEVERQRVATLFQELGLAAERKELRGHSPSVEEHLGFYNEVDIALDTFPYTGCTTTADALWMGVPVLTISGQLW